MSLKNCPDCGGDLGRGAVKCRCGWVAAGVPKGPTEKPAVPCAADPGCRYAGRLWVRSIGHNERLCVDHYYAALAKDPSLCGTPVIPPQKMMAGVTPKPVSGQ
jgi:hypothetical protein